LTDAQAGDEEPDKVTDREYDIFTMSLLDETVNFIIRRTDNGFEVCPLKDTPVKITLLFDDYKRIIGFKAADSKGNTYEYGGVLIPGQIGYSAFTLSKLRQPNGNEIKFNYIEDNSYLNHRNQAWDYKIIKQYSVLNNALWEVEPKTLETQFSNPRRLGFDYVLSSIVSGGIEILFKYSNGPFRLTEINQNENGQNIRNVKFSTSSDHLLGSLTIDNTAQYAFCYNPQRFDNVNRQDFYGYYNNATDWSCSASVIVPNSIDINTELNKTKPMSAYPITPISITADRTPSFPGTCANILTKVIYPTGGSSTFEYEPNKGHEPDTEKESSIGVRIRSITEYDPSSGKSTVRRFYYGKNRNGYGKALWKILGSDFIYDIDMVCNSYLGSNGQKYLFYPPKWDKRRTPSVMENSFVMPYFQTNLPVFYDEAVEETDEGYRKVTYSYTPDAIWGLKTNEMYTRYVNRFASPTPLLTSECYYKKGTATNDTLIKKIEYGYSNAGYGEIEGTVINSNVGFEGLNCAIPGLRGLIDAMRSISYSIFDGSEFEKQSYYIITGIDLLASKKETNYFYKKNGIKDSLKTTTTFEYDPVYRYNLKQQSSRSSQGFTIKEKIYYAHDVIEPLMDVNNMITTPLKKEIYLNKGAGDIALSSELFHYSLENPQRQVLLSAYEKHKGLNEELIDNRQFIKYDERGNLLEYIGKDGIKTAYLWSYNYQYPVAEIRNASYDQVKNSIGGDAEILNLSQTYTPNMDKVNMLKTSLPNTQIRIFTYNPSVGMTTQTTSNGIITSYDYDLSTRLSSVRDRSGKLVNQYSYRYYNDTRSESDLPTLSVSPTSLSFGFGNASAQVAVTNNTDWSVSRCDSWLSCTRGGSTLTIAASANSSSSSRTGQVMIAGVGLPNPVTITVTQAGVPAAPSLSATPSSFAALSGGRTGLLGTVEVTSNVCWSISYDQMRGPTPYVQVRNESGNAISSGCGNMRIQIYQIEGLSTVTPSAVILKTTDGSQQKTISIGKFSDDI
jgi:hypothetical protein